MWQKFRQILIENYSNIPYTSDVMVAYSNLTQQDDESTSQYLIRAKVLLKCINHTSMLSQISGKGSNNLALSSKDSGTTSSDEESPRNKNH